MHSWYTEIILRFFNISRLCDSSEAFFKSQISKKFFQCIYWKHLHTGRPTQFKLELFKGRLWLKYKTSAFIGCVYFLNLCCWSIVDLQCCVNFCCSVSGSVIHIHTHTHTFICILFHYDLLRGIEYSSLCYTVKAFFLIHSLYNNLPLLIPNFHSYFPHPTSPCSYKSVLFALLSVFDR